MPQPEAMRGRIMSIFHLTSRGLHPLGQTRTGLLVPLIGASDTAFLGGVVIAVVVWVTSRRAPSLPRFVIDDGLTVKPQRLRRPCHGVGANVHKRLQV